MNAAGLEARLRAALDPLDRAPVEPVHSDYDLNAGLQPFVRGPKRDAAVLVGLTPRVEGVTVLLTRRADSLASHTGQIAFPGGRLDPGETAVEAALREAQEEVGLDPALVRPLGLSDAYETVTGFVVTPVVAVVDPAAVLTPSPDEVAEIFEVPFDFLMDAANHRRDSFTAPDGQVRWFHAMPWGERYVWGATAGMLRALWARLEGDPEQARAVSRVASRGSA